MAAANQSSRNIYKRIDALEQRSEQLATIAFTDYLKTLSDDELITLRDLYKRACEVADIRGELRRPNAAQDLANVKLATEYLRSHGVEALHIRLGVEIE